jgi:hypothetical protein
MLELWPVIRPTQSLFSWASFPPLVACGNHYQHGWTAMVPRSRCRRSSSVLRPQPVAPCPAHDRRAAPVPPSPLAHVLGSFRTSGLQVLYSTRGPSEARRGKARKIKCTRRLGPFKLCGKIINIRLAKITR